LERLSADLVQADNKSVAMQFNRSNFQTLIRRIHTWSCTEATLAPLSRFDSPRHHGPCLYFADRM